MQKDISDRKRIVIIEDEKYILDMYAEIMQSSGFQVRTASTGELGLKCIAEFKPDLIMLDLMLPGIDGMEVLRVVRREAEKYGKPLIIILTNLSNEVMIKDAFYERADGYLMKTELTPEQVVNEVKGFFTNAAKAQ